MGWFMFPFVAFFLLAAVSGSRAANEGASALQHGAANEGVTMLQLGDQVAKFNGNVTYDGRSLIINGERKMLFSGSIHYPRSTPEMWPSLISKAKEGGLDAIDTYVFWNIHEPTKGQYDFTGGRDLVKFLKEIQKQGLYACLRIGPFIEAEWNFGGFPIWLRDIPGIVFRSYNQPFMSYMQKFTTKIVNMMKSECLYASQGGPIILSQIENEYQNVEAAFHQYGPPYVQWAAKMAVNLNTGVPWVMCKQDDAPDPVINTCNGLRCAETFKGPNSPTKPNIWTENWTMEYELFGKDSRQRSPTDIAFHVALFVCKSGGSFINYYMYHGGTNFGRTASAFVTTRYYSAAPLDEYGYLNQPLYNHLMELHATIKLCLEPLLYGTKTTDSLGQNAMQQAYIFRINTRKCAAFLVNNASQAANMQFQNSSYTLTGKSISILPDCKTVAFNTAKISTKYRARSIKQGQKLISPQQWQQFTEIVPDFDETSLRANMLLEQMSTTKDSSDYLWYTTRVEVIPSNTQPILSVRSLGHGLQAFVNGALVESIYGSHDHPALTTQIPLKKGMNTVALLSVMVGTPDSGAYLERRAQGINQVQFQAKDLTMTAWGYQVGLVGEQLKIYTEDGTSSIWTRLSKEKPPLTWYKTSFKTPEGNNPVVLNLASMGKGEAWINGQSIGRYWVSLKAASGNSSQVLYYIPSAFLKPKNNLLVLFEEESEASPLGISIDIILLPEEEKSKGSISIAKVCGHASNSHLLPNRKKGQTDKHVKLYGKIPQVHIQCPSTGEISKIIFASFGSPSGDCKSYAIGSCHSFSSKAIVEKACLGKNRCSIPLSVQIFGADPCPGIAKTLIVDAHCT